MSEIFQDEMKYALALAAKGRGHVEPNPMVGAVILDDRGERVGEGYHEKFGGPHAEIHALNQAGDRAKYGTLIVTLEPCCHQGKTPPCTDSVIQAGIRKVIVAMRDPFPKVDGGGIDQLRKAGIEVEIGLCERDAERLNAPYLTRLRNGRPWVISKWAMSLDGKIATHSGDSKWISSPASRELVHRIRGQVDAIMVGAETVRRDDPLLTARPMGSRIATRIVATRSGHLPSDCQLLQTIRQAPVLIWTTEMGATQLNQWMQAGAEIITLPTLPEFLRELGHRQMTNLFIEGGGQLHGLFHDSRLVDEVMVFVSPKILGGSHSQSPVGGAGVSLVSQSQTIDELTREFIGDDLFIRGVIQRSDSKG